MLLWIQSGKIKAHSIFKTEFSTGVGLPRGWNRWGFNPGAGRHRRDDGQQEVIVSSHPNPGVGNTGEDMTRAKDPNPSSRNQTPGVGITVGAQQLMGRNHMKQKRRKK